MDLKLPQKLNYQTFLFQQDPYNAALSLCGKQRKGGRHSLNTIPLLFKFYSIAEGRKVR